MVSRSDPTHDDGGEEACSTDIQRIQTKGGAYVLISEEKYQQLLDELETTGTALQRPLTRTEASKPGPANDTASCRACGRAGIPHL
jgi:hypothetical protein